MAIIDQKALDIFIKQALSDVPKSRAITDGVNFWTKVLASEGSLPRSSTKEMLNKYTSAYSTLYGATKKILLDGMKSSGLDTAGLTGLSAAGWGPYGYTYGAPEHTEKALGFFSKLGTSFAKDPLKWAKASALFVLVGVGSYLAHVFWPEGKGKSNLIRESWKSELAELYRIDPSQRTSDQRAKIEELKSLIAEDIRIQQQLEGTAFWETASRYLFWGVVIYGVAKVVGFLPSIIDPWADTTLKVKRAVGKGDDEGRGRPALPAGYGYPAPQAYQQEPAQRRSGGNHGGPAAPSPTPRKRPKTPPTATKGNRSGRAKVKF